MTIHRSDFQKSQMEYNYHKKDSYQKKSFALFVIALIVTLPLYSANAMAVSVAITKNSGEAGYAGYLNGEGDIWSIEATVSGAEEVSATDLRITLGGTADTFDTCSSTTLGTTCEYLSDLRGGVTEDQYSFDVRHIPSGAGDGDAIAVDGSAPDVQLLQAPRQTGSRQVMLDFSVADNPLFGVGLRTVDVLRADTGEVLQSFGPFEGRVMSFHYGDEVEGSFLEAPAGFFTGSGERRLKVRAVDRFGHERVELLGSFPADFEQPRILGETFNFTDLGEFMGIISQQSDITVDVREEGESLRAQLFSDQLEFVSNDADCELIEESLWRCTWSEVSVSPVSSVSARVVATDGSGNIAEQTLTQSFTVDTQAPTVEFLGTLRQFNGQSYVHDGENLIVLRVREQGVGMEPQGVALDLRDLGGGSSVVPTAAQCSAEGGLFTCNFSVSPSGLAGRGAVQVIMNKLEDKVGNRGELISQSFQVDTLAPYIDEVEIFGVSSVDGREKDAIQGNDLIRVKLKVREDGSGLLFKMNLQDLISGAEDEFPAGPLMEEAGWEVFSEEGNCQRAVGLWECQFTSTKPVHSAHDSRAQLELVLEDTPGNAAESWPAEHKNRAELQRASGTPSRADEGRYEFEKLGVLDDPNLDLWEFDEATTLDGRTEVENALENYFVDLDTVRLTQRRYPLQLHFDPLGGNVKALSMELLGCQPTENVTIVPAPTTLPPELRAPTLRRSILYGDQFIGTPDEPGVADPKPNLILEWEPFEAREAFGLGKDDFEYVLAEYSCQVRIFSRVGNDALSTPETEVFIVKIPFAFSKLGALDENLAEKVAKRKEAVDTGFYGVIGDLREVLKWVDYVTKLLSWIITLAELVVKGEVLVGTGFEVVPKEYPPTTAGKISFCFGTKGTETGLMVINDFLKPIVSILNCNPHSGWGWYDKWVNMIPNLYNTIFSNFEVLAFGNIDAGAENAPWARARSVRDNLPLSLASLCLPGIIQGFDKLRQIECRTIYCLENEVPAGVATVDSCERLEELLRCKYWWGELWYLMPFSQFLDEVMSALQRAWADPIALGRNAIIIGCSIHCVVGEIKMSAGCSLTKYVFEWIDFLENLVSGFTSLERDLRSGGLQYCDIVLKEEELPEAPSTTPEQLERLENRGEAAAVS